MLKYSENTPYLFLESNFYCVNTSYPMDNCFTGRRDRSCQMTEKVILYKLPAGLVTECTFTRCRLVHTSCLDRMTSSCLFRLAHGVYKRPLTSELMAWPSVVFVVVVVVVNNFFQPLLLRNYCTDFFEIWYGASLGRGLSFFLIACFSTNQRRSHDQKHVFQKGVLVWMIT